MIKKIAVAICMCAALGANAQKIELGVAGGVKPKTGYAGSVAGYLSFWKLQVGAVAEVGNIDYSRFRSRESPYTVFTPGANLNFKIPFARGYAYPGLRYRYITNINGNDLNKVRGSEMGVHGGVVVKIFKSLSANAELGAALQTTKKSPGIMYTDGNGVTVDIPRHTDVIVFPAMLGLRWAF